MNRSLSVSARDLKLSWATGSGLPICCISGLAVAEEGWGSRCNTLEEVSVQTFWEQLLNFHSMPLDTGDKRENKHERKSCLLVNGMRKYQKGIYFGYV